VEAGFKLSIRRDMRMDRPPRTRTRLPCTRSMAWSRRASRPAIAFP